MTNSDLDWDMWNNIGNWDMWERHNLAIALVNSRPMQDLITGEWREVKVHPMSVEDPDWYKGFGRSPDGNVEWSLERARKKSGCSYCGNRSGKRDRLGGCISCGAPL